LKNPQNATKPTTKTASTPKPKIIKKTAEAAARDNKIWYIRQAAAAAFALGSTLWFFNAVQNTENRHLFQGLEDWYRTWIQGWFDIEEHFWNIAQEFQTRWDTWFLQTCDVWEDISTRLQVALVYLNKLIED